MSRLRSTSVLLVVILGWMAAAPVLAITCVPGHECPMAGMAAGASGRPALEGGGVVSSPDCCLRSERRAESGTLQRSVTGHPETAAPLGQVAALEAVPVSAPRAPAHERSVATEVPLYTLHSILLI
jgi:hypothetical protein